MLRILIGVAAVSALCIAATTFARPSSTILFAGLMGLLWLVLSSYQGQQIESIEEAHPSHCRSCGEELADAQSDCPMCGAPQ